MEDLFKKIDKSLEELGKNIDELEIYVNELADSLESETNKYNNLLKDLEDNYKPINPYEMFGVNEGDFH